MKIECTQEEFSALKDKATRLKVIQLHREGMNITTDISKLEETKKRKIHEEIELKFSTMADEAILTEFNSIVNHSLKDYTNFQVTHESELPPEDPKGEAGSVRGL